MVVKKSSCSLLKKKKKKKFKPGPINWTWLINNQNHALFSVPANCGNSQKKKEKLIVARLILPQEKGNIKLWLYKGQPILKPTVSLYD